jgi:penicillin amidase
MLRLWSGNNRQLAAEGGSAIGEGGFDLGARGQQIRDRLLEAKIFDEAGLYNIQLDTEARFMKRWVARVSAVADANRDNTNALAALVAPTLIRRPIV